MNSLKYNGTYIIYNQVTNVVVTTKDTIGGVVRFLEFEDNGDLTWTNRTHPRSKADILPHLVFPE